MDNMTAFEKRLAAAARVAAQTRRIHAQPITMHPKGYRVAERAPPKPIIIVSDGVMTDAAKLASFLYVRRMTSAY